jgi:hypothetical protein
LDLQAGGNCAGLSNLEVIMVARTVRRKTGWANGAGRQAANSPFMSGLAKAGFVARGVMYALIGIIAVQIAVGHSHQQADRSGAVRVVAATPFGAVILWLMVAGFAGMTLWRLSEAICGAAGPDGHKPTSRLGSLGRAVIYGVITYGILKFALGLGAPASSNKQSQDLTATALKYPGGQVLVVVAGAVIAIAGVVLMYQAWRASFLRRMRFGTASAATRKVVRRLGQIGGVARGAVFVTIGIFLAIAAINAKPGQAKGIDSGLLVFAHTPLGPWLLVLVAVGLIMFGAFSGCEARGRDV